MKAAAKESNVRVAVDVMGTDLGPRAIIEGTLKALDQDPELSCILVGTEDALGEEHLPEFDSSRLATHLASEFIANTDEPVEAVRRKRDASTLKAVRLVRLGAADAAVSAAHTGAVLLAGGALLRRLTGVLQPALGTILAPLTGQPSVLIDCGGSTTRNAAWIQQFAVFGAIVAETFLDRQDPSIGLLANGTEVTKGDEVIKDAHQRLRKSELRYVGLVEPFALYTRDPDVVVTDGLLGNILLKTLEATSREVVCPLLEVLDTVRHGSDLPGKWRDFSGFKLLSQIGWGALLLGIDGVLVKAHGIGTAEGTLGAVKLAGTAVRKGLLSRMQQATALAFCARNRAPIP